MELSMKLDSQVLEKLSITFPIKLARLSLSISIFSKSKTMLFHLFESFSKGKKICNSTISSITFPTKFARWSLSMFMVKSFMIFKPKSVLFDLFYDFLKVYSPFKSYIIPFCPYLTHRHTDKH